MSSRVQNNRYNKTRKEHKKDQKTQRRKQLVKNTAKTFGIPLVLSLVKTISQWVWANWFNWF